MTVDAFRLTTVLSTMLSDQGIDGEPVVTRQEGNETALDVSVGRGDDVSRFRLAVTQPLPRLPRRRFTDDMLIHRVDPTLAVERAMSAAEYGVFTDHVLVGRMDGAKPADWLDAADDADAFSETVDQWWAEHGEKALDYLRVRFELPEQLLKRLLTLSLYVDQVTRGLDLGPAERTHIEIAAAAATYVRGYADALGWTPTYDTVAD